MRKIVPAMFAMFLFCSMVLIVPIALGQWENDVTYELTCEVTSTTALWNPGAHDFQMTMDGELFAPFADTFTANGSGFAAYSMVGGGFPPGEFDLTIAASGYLANSFFTGPYELAAIAHGETVQVSTTEGFVRTEEIHDLSVNGSFSGFMWNATSATSVVDFSYINIEGTLFQFRVTGTSHAYVIPEFSSLIGLPLIMIATLIAALIYRKKPPHQAATGIPL